MRPEPASKRLQPGLGPSRRRSERGFALLLVLWSLVALSLLGTQLTAGARGEARLASNVRDGAMAQAAADGAIYEALFHLLDSSAAHWPADGEIHAIQHPGARVQVVARSEGGKVNPSSAPPELLRALLHAVGADDRAASAVAVAISDWRFPDAQEHAMRAKTPQYRAAGRPYGPPDAPFETMDELGLVLGMTPDLLTRLAPHLTLHHEGDPDAGLADPLVLQAMREWTGVPPAAQAGMRDDSVVSITATAEGPNGSRATRRAIARVGGNGAGRPYRILTWDSAAP